MALAATLALVYRVGRAFLAQLFLGSLVTLEVAYRASQDIREAEHRALAGHRALVEIQHRAILVTQVRLVLAVLLVIGVHSGIQQLKQLLQTLQQRLHLIRMMPTILVFRLVAQLQK